MQSANGKKFKKRIDLPELATKAERVLFLVLFLDHCIAWKASKLAHVWETCHLSHMVRPYIYIFAIAHTTYLY